MSKVIRTANAELVKALKLAIPEVQTFAEVQAPPSEDVIYPAIAILPEKFKLTTQVAEQVLNPDGTPTILGGQRGIFECGALRGSVRIWAGARLPAQREQLEDKIRKAFFQDDLALGRLMVSLDDIEVDGERTGASWPVAYFLDDEEWHEEMVFSEKRWSFMHVLVDVPILIARDEAWQVTEMVVALTRDVSTVIATPADVAVPPLDDLRQNTVNDDGSVGPPPT